MARPQFASILCLLLAGSVVFAPVVANAADRDETSNRVGEGAEKTLITKEWKIPPDLIPGVDKLDAATIGDREIGKNWLIANGVTFEDAASATYILKSSRLIVRNTQDQLDLVDTILKTDGNAASVVEIECRLVEIQEEQFPARPYPIVAHTGPGLSIDANTLQELLFPPLPHSSLPSLLRGVLTAPQMRMLEQLFAQKKKEVVEYSWPKVIVKSGQPAVLEFIRQFGSLTESLPPQLPKPSQSALVAEKVALRKTTASALPSRPARFLPADGNVAVVLEVRPIVGPDGYTIDLSLSPQITEFDGIAGYGAPFISSEKAPLDQASVEKVVTPQPTPHPVFSSRKVSSDVSIFDGSTLIFGNLIADTMPVFISVDRSDGAKSVRHGLVLCVTARLLKADLSPIRTDDEKEEEIIPLKPPAKVPPVTK